MDELAIRVEDVSKVYRLYNRPSERLFDALGIAGKGRFKDFLLPYHCFNFFFQGI